MEDRINTVLRLTAAARSALNCGDFLFAPADYMDSVNFRFMPRSKSGSVLRTPTPLSFGGSKDAAKPKPKGAARTPRPLSFGGGFKAKYAEQWYDHLEALGLCNVYADFDYSAECIPSVCCEFEDGCFTRFEVHTEIYRHRFFESDVGLSDFYGAPLPAVRWTWSCADWKCMRAAAAEAPCEPYTKRFRDNTEALRCALLKAEAFAMRLEIGGEDCRDYARAFSEAVHILDGQRVSRCGFPVALPPLPEDMLRIYRACETADIHDKRCGWHERPARLAGKAGASEEFTAVSDELLTQMRNALLYSVNEAYNRSHTDRSVVK